MRYDAPEHILPHVCSVRAKLIPLHLLQSFVHCTHVRYMSCETAGMLNYTIADTADISACGAVALSTVFGFPLNFTLQWQRAAGIRCRLACNCINILAFEQGPLQ